MKLIIILLLSLFYLFPAPFVVAESSEQILFSDNFSDGNLDGWVIEYGNWYINNGNLAGSQSGRAFGGRIDTGNSEWDNYRLEMDVDNQSGVDEGVGFRYIPNVSGYEFNLRHGTGNYNTPEIILRKAQDGVVSIIGDTHSFPLINGKWYHLKVEVFGENIKFWIDNTQIFDITDKDTKVKKGTVTLSYWTGDFGSDYTRFDNIKVTSLKTPLILIPGIGGSELKVGEDTLWSKDDGHEGTYNRAYSKDEKVWVNESEAAKPGDDDYFDVLRMKEDGVTSEASLDLTGNLYNGAYQAAINFFTANGYTLNQDLFIFPYDWRRDVVETKASLDNEIGRIKTQTGSQKVDIISHSMGGLVARNYIADSAKAQNVRKLLTLGTPHLGSVKFLKYLHFGGCFIYEVGPFCLAIAPAELNDVLQNLITGYQLAPSQIYFNFYDNTDNNHPYPYRTDSGVLNYNQIKNLLTSLGYNTPLFNPSEIFHSIDNTLSNTNGVDVTLIVGSGQDTLGQIIEQKTTSLLGIQGTHKDIININGDDTVPLYSASLNDPDKNHSLLGSAKVYYTKQKHGELVSNGSALNLVKNILEGNSQLPSGVSTQPYPLHGVGLSVHSPVNIHAYDANGNHTGPTADGFETNIPGSSYDTLDDAKFIFLPENGVYNIKFEVTGTGSFDFKIRDYKDDVNDNTFFYNDVPLTQNTKAQASFDTNSSNPPTLQLDEDGNGTTDKQVDPTSVLTGSANLDETAPKTEVKLTGDAENDWYRSDVNVELSAEDEPGGSEVLKTEYSLDNGQTIQDYIKPFILSQEGLNKLKFRSIDKAGNTENPIEKGVKIDKTKPEINCDSADSNWYKDDVSISCSADDNGSGLAQTADSNFSLTTSLPDNTENADVSTNSKDVCDLAGNCNTAGSITGNKIDKKAPDISLKIPSQDAIYYLNQQIPADYFCNDNGSGLDTCLGSLPANANLDTSSVGTKTFVVNAKDKADNTSSQTITYKVQYLNSGICNSEPGHVILQPINTNGSSVFKQGSTVPAKFRVCDLNGVSIGWYNVVSNFKLVQTTSGTTISSVNESVNSTTPDSSFRWDPTNKLWIFNMNTKTLSSGKTYFYRISLNDLTSVDFSFGLK